MVIAAAAYYTWRHSPTATGPSEGAEPPLVSQLPPGAPYVLYADVAALRNAAFLAKLAALVPAPAEDPEYSEFVRATGFDYSRDLDRVAITAVPGASESAVWTLADGRFDQQKIQAYALRSGKTEQREGQIIYAIDSGPSANEVTLRFLSPTRIEIVSRPKRSAQDNAPENTPSTPAPMPGDSAAFRDHIARVSGSPVFAVVRMDSVPKDLTLGALRMDQITGMLQNVHWLSLAVTPEGENLRVILEGECGSTIESTKLQLFLESLRMLGRGLLSDPGTRRQFTPQGAEALNKLARQIDISHDGPHVRVMAVLSPDMLAGLAAPPPNPAAAPKRAPANR